MTTNIVIANVQGTETSAKVNYKGTTKDAFEVGCQYENNCGPKFEVIARKGNKLTIKYLRSNYYHKEGDIENKRIYLAGGEDTNFTEYVKWNFGWEVCALNKVQGTNVQEEYKEELRDTLQEMYEHLTEAASLGSDADDFFNDLGEENEDIVYITSTLYDAINMLKNLVKQQQKVA